METANSCTIGQLDTRGGERVRLVALRVGAVITERNDSSRHKHHQVRLYQIATRRDDLLATPPPYSSVPGSVDMMLSIVGDLPAGLEPGSVLRLLVVDPRVEQDPGELASWEAK